MNFDCKSEMREKLETILKDNKVVLVSGLDCPPCKKIKKLFQDNSIKFFDADVGHPDNDELFYCIYEKSNSGFIPQIFLNSQYIGGYIEGITYFNQGKF